MRFPQQSSRFQTYEAKKSYYTFSDFFIQHADEIPPQGISITYSIAHNNWTKVPPVPTGVGVATQVRKKVKDGKWNDYHRRILRTVVFLGIERIVPHSERSQSRSYSKVFKAIASKGWEENVKDAVGYILGKKYDDLKFLAHSKYSLPVVSSNGISYSGFNMGAGENALFEIFSTIYSAGKGALLVLDEIELGLHAEAQRKFMDKLKDVCLEMHTQVICTTHSTIIFDCLPNEARFYLESLNGKTRITSGISSEYAFSKMSALPGLGLDIFVEDDIAECMLQVFLPSSIRSRVTIVEIGSSSALARQLAAKYLHPTSKPTIAVFDGDQRALHTENRAYAKSMAEKAKQDFETWFDHKSSYLPGSTWPEAWILEKSKQCLTQLSNLVGCEQDDLPDIIEYGLQAGKHNEFNEVSKHLGLKRMQCVHIFCSAIQQSKPAEFIELISKITSTLSGS